MSKKPTFRDIADALRNDPEPFATQVIGEAPTYRTSSQVRYFDNQSLVVFIGGSAQGRFKWFLDEEAKGDMIDLHQRISGSTKHEAIEFAKNFLGLGTGEVDIKRLNTGPSPEERRRQQEEEDLKRIRTAQWIWSKTSPTDGREEGLTYLCNRGITCDISSDTLRFRKLSPRDLEKMGVAKKDIPSSPVTSLVFAARNKDGDITAVQQVLTADGAKVRFENPKRTNGLMAGSSVWLGDPKSSHEAILVEGPETGASLFQATGIPTCVTLGTSNFTKIHLPGNIDTLITASDMEPTGVGLASALRTAQFWQQNGIERSGIALPRLNDGDFNDVHQHFGEEAVAGSVRKAFFPPSREADGTVLVTPDARSAFYAWIKTGVEVSPRVPGRNKETGKFFPISLEAAVEPRHNRVMIVGNPAIEIKQEQFRKDRPDAEIIELHDDSRIFRALAKTDGAMEAAINSVDVYAPDGVGTDEPVFFSLRRADADAMKLEGHKSIAVRSTAIDRVDLSFMKGRDAIIAPIGNGTDHDARLTARLNEAGSQTTRLTWQIFRGDDSAPKILRREVPAGYGAADAAQEGWRGDTLRDLIDISRANHCQMMAPREEEATHDRVSKRKEAAR